MLKKRLIIMLTSLAMFAAGQQKPLLLYPNGVPNSKTAAAYAEKRDGDFVSQVNDPTITPYFPPAGSANGSAVIIFPGGSYINLATGHEGRAVAEAFNRIGVTAFVVKYRLPNDAIMEDKTIGPLQDAERAIQMVREQAAAWRIDPHKVGIIGFSAGGHLASTLATHFTHVVISNPGRLSLRPDFAMLIYPVVSFGPFAHAFSRQNLIGLHPSQQLVDMYSNEKQVSAETPPCFLVHAEDDDVVPVQNSLAFYDALLKNKVKAELLLFEEGGHGFGLNNPRSATNWFDLAAAWMHENGF